MKIKLIVDAGDMKPGPALSQKLGPAGINISKVIQDVNSATASFKGVKVPVEIDVDTKTKKFKIDVFTPPVSELLKKELKIEKGSGQPNKIRIGNLAIEQIISVAKTKMPGMLASNIKSAVKNVLGNCVSLGVLIESKSPKEIIKEIDEGKYESEIKNQKTDVSDEKRQALDSFFAELKKKQDAMIEKEKAEAEKAEEAAAKPEAEKAVGAAKAEAEVKKVEEKTEKKEEKPGKKK